MTEYWKSQARKYCEFCKCWYADNKVSISFHENGKRHKENVQKHISTLTKKSTKDLKQKEKMDDDIKKMEKAAMAAYLKDVQNNADLTSQSINEMVSQSMGTNSSSTTIVVNNQPAKKSPPVWNEVKSDDGSSYFWNTVTNETTWDPPDEYLSIADQEKQKLNEGKQEKKKLKMKEKKQKEAQKEVYKEVNAHLAREKMRELAVSKDELSSVKPAVDYGPVPRAVKPYGSWTPVLSQPAENVDLQLPSPDSKPAPPPVVVQPETVEFKEKRVQSLGDGPVEFKKRKLNNNKRNIRQKIDDD